MRKYRSERALGRGNRTGAARIEFEREAQGAGESFEHGFALVVRVLATQVVDVHRHEGVVGEALEEFMRQLAVESTDHAALEGHVHDEARAAGKIDDHAGQGFVQRYIGMAIAADALLVAHRLVHSLAQRDADILHRMVPVDMQVPLGLDIQVDEAMPGDLVQHMVEETYARGELRLAGAVQVDPDGDLGFRGVAGDFGGTRGGHKEASRAASICAFSSAVPTVRRRQLASNGCILETFLTSTPRPFMPSKARAASGTRTRIMFASLLQACTLGIAASFSSSKPRWRRSSAACWSKTSACSRANSAASQFSTLTLYG